MPEGRERQEETKEKLFEKLMIQNYPQIGVRHQTTDSGSSESTKQYKCQKKKKKKKPYILFVDIF